MTIPKRVRTHSQRKASCSGVPRRCNSHPKVVMGHLRVSRRCVHSPGWGVRALSPIKLLWTMSQSKGGASDHRPAVLGRTTQRGSPVGAPFYSLVGPELWPPIGHVPRPRWLGTLHLLTKGPTSLFPFLGEKCLPVCTQAGCIHPAAMVRVRKCHRPPCSGP